MLSSPASPIVFSIGNFSLRYYSLCILVAVLVAQYIAVKRAEKKHIQVDHIYNIVIYALIFGLIGARLFHVLYEYPYYFSHLSDIPKIWEGGLAIHGGLIFGALTIFLYCKKHTLSFLEIADIFTPSMLVGQIIGRFGNYFNQEAFGTPTNLPWGIYIKPLHRPDQFMNSEYFHPTFLYEGLWNAGALFIILFLEKQLNLRKGSLLGIYLIFYGIGRSLIEFIRTDATFFGSFRFVHWLSFLFVILGIIFLSFRRKKS